MSKVMPQEIEVWYLLPALRKELVLLFVEEHGMRQKQAAGLLGLTESAVSQYRKCKRGSELTFNAQERSLIREVGEKIIADPKHASEHLYVLCREFRGSPTMCGLHRKLDDCIPDNCTLCHE